MIYGEVPEAISRKNYTDRDCSLRLRSLRLRSLRLCLGSNLSLAERSLHRRSLGLAPDWKSALLERSRLEVDCKIRGFAFHRIHWTELAIIGVPVSF
jgi:hypothetical protein